MQEQLISFETAKLAKEKQFQEYTPYFYTEETGLCSIDGDGDILNIYNNDLTLKDIICDCNGDFWFRGEDEKFEFYEPIKYPTPTQSFLQKWLREKYKLEVHVSFNPDWEWNDKDECLCVNKGYRVDWGFVGIWKKYETESYPLEKSNISTYEEALEVGLQEALKLIK